jgi:hypothetical protein
MRFQSETVAYNLFGARRRRTQRQDQRGLSMGGAFASSADTAHVVVMKKRAVSASVLELENRLPQCLTTFVKTGVIMRAI